MKLRAMGKEFEAQTVAEFLKEVGFLRAIDIFLFRHDSAVLNVEDIGQLMGYCNCSYNPPLKEKGINSAKVTAERVAGFVDEWHSSPSRRAQETAKILAGDQPVAVDDELRPANYALVPNSAITRYQKDALGNDPEADAKLGKAYIATGVHIMDQQVMVQFVMETSLNTAGVVGYVSHDEKCRELVAFLLGLKPEELTDPRCAIQRGGYAEINIRPDGKVGVTKVSADGQIKKLR